MRLTALLLTVFLVAQPMLPQQRATFSTTTNVVIVNVTVLDRNGRPIENLTKDDFQLFEDGKLQKLQAVDLQRLNTRVLPSVNSAEAQPPAPAPKAINPEAEKAALKSSMLSKYQDRRLMIMLFDFSSMQPAEQIRAKQAAIKFLECSDDRQRHGLDHGLRQ